MHAMTVHVFMCFSNLSLIFCRLLICPMFLHLGMSAMFAWRQHDRYYNKKKKHEREMRINVQDPSQGGTDILF